jgi:hypothetical protein
MAAGADVVALSRDREQARQVLGDGVDVLEGDLRRFGEVPGRRPEDWPGRADQQ